jgi:hypothetical protein
MVKRYLDAAYFMIFILKLMEKTVASVTVPTESEKGRTHKHHQFANKVLKTRCIGFAGSGRHPHRRVTAGFAIVGELFSH